MKKKTQTGQEGGDTDLRTKNQSFFLPQNYFPPKTIFYYPNN